MDSEIISAFNDPVLIRLTHEDIRVIKTHGCPDEEFLGALSKANKTDDGFILACRRENLIDINCVLAAVGEDLTDKDERKKLMKTYCKIEHYEFG